MLAPDRASTGEGFKSSRRPAGGTSVRSFRRWMKPTSRAGSSLVCGRNRNTTLSPSRSIGFDPEPVRHDANPAVVGQVQDRRRQRAVAVANLADDAIELAVRPRRRNAAIDGQPLVHVGDVLVVDLQIDAQVNRRADIVLDLLALQLAHGFFEQLRIHLEADGLHVAALFAAEQIAGAADFEVERGDTESAAEIAELLDCGEPLLGHRRQASLRAESAGMRRPVDRIGRPVRAADRAATGRSDRRG